MEPWELGPFKKLDLSNPVLAACDDSRWRCDLAGDVAWEQKDVFNPAAVVHEGKVHLLYRAEDTIGRFMGTSRVGLAISDDGINFHREASPVLFPSRDANLEFEAEGGCEDPRVCYMPDGRFLMTYTAFDGVKARLCIATSWDLRSWTKHGLAFPEMAGLWCKAGSIVCKLDGDRMVAKKLNGKFWMYFGESYIFAATSDDLIRWEPVKHATLAHKSTDLAMPSAPDIASNWSSCDVGVTMSDKEAFVSVARPRVGRFDSGIIEPGPPALLTEHGIVLLYHGKNDTASGSSALPAGTYCVGQMLLDPLDPSAVLCRPTDPFLVPDRNYEIVGQVGNVCFAEGLVKFRGHWMLYYGTADSKIAVAVS